MSSGCRESAWNVSRRSFLAAAGLTALAASTAGSVVAAPAAFAGVTPTDPRAGAGFSLNSGILWESAESRSRSLDLVAAMGATSIRLDLSWYWAERSSGKFDWSLFDPIINGAQSRGLSVLAVLGSAPPWAATNPKDGKAHNRPASLTTWERYVKTAAKRYRGKIFAYEIWNEPNGRDYFWPAPDPEFFTSLVRTAVSAIKSSAPGTLTIAGALGPAPETDGNMTAPEFAARMIRAGIVSTGVDHYAFHPYDFDGTMAESARWDLTAVRQAINFSAALQAAGAKNYRVWATEYGFPSSLGVDRQSQMLTTGLTQWPEMSFAGPVYLHELKDQNGTDTFGVFDQQGTPKNSAYAVQWTLQNRQPARDEAVRFDANADSALGAALSPVYTVGSDAWGRDYTKGTRFQTPTGWFSSPKEAGKVWRCAGIAPSGPFASGMQNGPTGIRLFFKEGLGAYFVVGAILDLWSEKYGFPLAGQTDDSSGGTSQEFENGTISWSPNAGVRGTL